MSHRRPQTNTLFFGSQNDLYNGMWWNLDHKLIMPTKEPQKKSCTQHSSQRLLNRFWDLPTLGAISPISNRTWARSIFKRLPDRWNNGEGACRLRRISQHETGHFSNMWCRFHLARFGLIESRVASREDFKGILFGFCQFYCTLYPASKNAQQISFVARTMQLAEAKQECHVLVEYSHGQTIQTIAVYTLFER